MADHWGREFDSLKVSVFESSKVGSSKVESFARLRVQRNESSRFQQVSGSKVRKFEIEKSEIPSMWWHDE